MAMKEDPKLTYSQGHTESIVIYGTISKKKKKKGKTSLVTHTYQANKEEKNTSSR